MANHNAAAVFYRPAFCAACVVAVVVCLFVFSPLCESWEFWTQDRRFVLRGISPNKPVERIVLVEIADPTLEKHYPKEPTVFWSRHYAAAIGRAFEWEASLVGLDFIPALTYAEFADAAGLDVTNRLDVPLAEQADKAGKRLIFASLLSPDGRHQEVHPFFRADADSNGFINELIDGDGVVRRTPLYRQETNRIIPSFDALLALRYRNSDPTQPQSYSALTHRTQTQEGVTSCLFDWVQRTDYDGKSFPTYRLEDVVQGKLTPQQIAHFKDAIVIMGASYAGSKDFKPTPISSRVSGIEIHGHAVSSLLSGSSVARLPHFAEALLSLAFGLGICALTRRVGSLPLTAFCAVFAAAWLTVAIAVFASQRVLLPVVAPLLAIGVPLAAFHACRAFIETTLRENFMRYVPPEVSLAMMTDPDKLELGGKTEYISVLFFDLRNSTENVRFADPQDYLDEMNTLFLEIEPILGTHHGTLSTFTGDGFMALFGAPHRLENHARCAFDAAQEILHAVIVLNQRRHAENKPPRRAGIGIASGAPVCGNLGTVQRMTYTALGETVNIAARLEQMNKKLETVLTVSEETYNRLHPAQQRNATVHKAHINDREEASVVYTWKETALELTHKEDDPCA